MKQIFAALFILIFASQASAETEDYVFHKKVLLIAAPPVINKDYYGIEFGFVTEKKVKNYKYNAFVAATLFEDWKKQSGNLRAGALGFKGGIMMPTQNWIPLLWTFSGGFAKTALHKDPFFGKNDGSKQKKDMLFLETGLIYHFDDKYFIRGQYRIGTVKYFKTHTIFAFGVNY